MKKSVVILIAIIYIASIALVSFFGLQFKVFNEEVYVDRIEVLNLAIEEAKGSKYYQKIPKGTNENGETIYDEYILVSIQETQQYDLNLRVHPDNATNKKVNYAIETSPNGCATIDENGVLTLHKTGTVKIVMSSADGSGAQTSITVIIHDQKLK